MEEAREVSSLLPPEETLEYIGLRSEVCPRNHFHSLVKEIGVP